MKKANLLKSLALVFLILCTVAIVVVCAVFVNNENNKNGGNTDDNTNTPSSYSFTYGDSLTMCLYEIVDFSPTNTTQLLIYTSSDNSILTISQNGSATANKCGSATISVREGDKIIKTVTVNIIANYTFECENCTYSNGIITMTSYFATVNFCLLDKNLNKVDNNPDYTISATGVMVYNNFGMITIEADENGSFTLTFEEINLEVTINVIAK